MRTQFRRFSNGNAQTLHPKCGWAVFAITTKFRRKKGGLIKKKRKTLEASSPFSPLPENKKERNTKTYPSEYYPPESRPETASVIVVGGFKLRQLKDFCGCDCGSSSASSPLHFFLFFLWIVYLNWARFRIRARSKKVMNIPRC